MTPPVVWLASYPKSGNTWVRALLTAYVGDTSIDINRLDGSVIASARHVFDDAVGVSSADLDPQEVERLRPHVYRHQAAAATGPLLMKVHDAYRTTSDGQPLFPPDITRSAVYIVRHPADVALSLAHHSNVSIDEAIDRMAREDFVFSPSAGRLDEQLPQRLGSWSHHVTSWVSQSVIPVRLVRYEDLLSDGAVTLAGLVGAVGAAAVASRVERALDVCRFDRLRTQELERGFKERPGSAKGLFFRRGQAGSWRDEMSQAQYARVAAAHERVMERLGYIE